MDENEANLTDGEMTQEINWTVDEPPQEDGMSGVGWPVGNINKILAGSISIFYTFMPSNTDLLGTNVRTCTLM